MTRYNYIVREVRMDGTTCPHRCEDIHEAREKCEELQMIGDWMGTIAAEIVEINTGKVVEVYDI